jgi:2-methylisocitrate lyase-like PEP mutase family enzyme
MSRTESFRALHESPFVIPNPWDVGSAKMLVAWGFQALATTSAGAANVAGLSDDHATLEVILANAAAIAAAVDVPVAADLQDGYDDPAATIRLAVDEGLAGGSIEDWSGQGTYPLDEAVERVRAAAAEAARTGFVLTARCENHLYGVGTLDDTIRRLQAYDEAGADVLYAPGLPDLDSVREVCKAVGKPVNVLAGSHSVQELFDAGATRISLGSAFYSAAMGAFKRAVDEVREQGTFTFKDGGLPYAEANGYMS